MISGKSVQKSAVTCLVWPSSQNNYVMGLADGKVSVCVCMCVREVVLCVVAGEVRSW